MSEGVKKRTTLLIVVGTILVIAGGLLFYMPSTPSEPSGFGGIQWGAPSSSFAGLALIAEDGDLKYYESKNDADMKVGGVAMDRIVYGFHKDRFYNVMVYFHSRSIFDSLKKNLTESLGGPSQPDQSPGKAFWNGQAVSVLLTYDDAAQAGRLIYFFKPIQLEAELTKP